MSNYNFTLAYFSNKYGMHSNGCSVFNEKVNYKLKFPFVVKHRKIPREQKSES